MLDMLQPRLSDIAAWHGIIPVPNDVFEEHKRAELRKHPGSWWYRHETLVHVGPPISFTSVAIIGIFSAAFTIISLISGLFFAAGMLAMLSAGSFLIARKLAWIMNHVIHIKGPAEWHERQVYLNYFSAPEPIVRMAARIMQDNSNDMRLIVGTLKQDSVILDPYLLVRRGDDQIVLGIWDGNVILHQATEA